NAIGPIPKRKTKKIWARFKKAIDSIQDQRRSFFKHQRVEQKENLAKKRAFIDKIIELASSENLEEVLPEVKQIQSDFQSVGFVPIKQKNKIWDEYRSACDVFFKALRATGSHSKTADSTHPHSSGSAPRSEVKIKQQELYKLKKECDKLNDIILQYADTKTYIKPNKKGIALIEEIQQ